MLLFHTPTGVKSVTGPLLPYHSPVTPPPLPRRLVLSLGLAATQQALVMIALGAKQPVQRGFCFERIYVN